MDKNKDILLKRIARHLMLYSCFNHNIGLLNGKLGVVIFFYFYARYSKITYYDTFAGELLDEIYSEINVNNSVNFNDGLCGIGWGIDFLIRNKFVEGDVNEILVDIDKTIFYRDIEIIIDDNLKFDFKGHVSYVINRNFNDQKIFNKSYLLKLHDLLQSSLFSEDYEAFLLKEELANIIKGIPSVTRFCPLLNLIEKMDYNCNCIFNDKRPIGIENNGYTGIALNFLLMNK